MWGCFARRRSGRALASSVDELDALGLAARQRGARLGAQEVDGFIDAQLEHLADMLAAEGHRQRLRGETVAAADFAGYGDVGQEVHLHALITLAFAGRAATKP